jgi:hypothetical protein
MKNQPEKQQSVKACFGTKEWSKSSGICKGCKLKEACGKIKLKRE